MLVECMQSMQRCLNGEQGDLVKRRDSGSGKEVREGGSSSFQKSPARVLQAEEEEAGWSCVEDERGN